MTTVKCPTDCEHDYMFAHSIVITERFITMVESGDVYKEIREFVICRECSHWIDGRECNCRARCHQQTGGTLLYMIEPERGTIMGVGKEPPKREARQ
jgi:hypothetical protein